MRKSEALLGFVILAVIAACFYLWYSRKPEVAPEPGPPGPEWPEGVIPVEPFHGGWWETDPASLKGSERVLVQKATVDISTARAAPGTLFNYVGSQIFVRNPLGVTKSVYIRFNNPSAQKFDLTKLTRLKIPFGQFYIENEAGTGTLELWISKGYLIEFTSAVSGNKPALATGQKDITAAGTAEQLDDVDIPDGYKVVLVAKPGNTGYVYLGNSEANAESATARLDRLEAGDSIALQVTNLNLVWADVSVSGEGVSWYVEQ